MEGALIILAVTAAVGLLLFWHDRRQRRRQPAANPGEEPKKESPKGCCGLHLVCEKENPALPGDAPEYYEDEELDRLAGRDPEEYTPEEVEEIRDIMLTMRPEETLGWARSLDRRQIRLPRELRDELQLLIRENCL